jgi:hypothetical protein
MNETLNNEPACSKVERYAQQNLIAHRVHRKGFGGVQHFPHIDFRLRSN